jgi:hypothetical protein
MRVPTTWRLPHPLQSRNSLKTLKLLSLVCLSCAQSSETQARVDPTKRATLAVRAIMTPSHELTTVTPEEASTEALQALSRHEVNQLRKS